MKKSLVQLALNLIFKLNPGIPNPKNVPRFATKLIRYFVQHDILNFDLYVLENSGDKMTDRSKSNFQTYK